MDKRAWLLHGTGGSDADYFWFADTKQYLEAKGYKVWWPQLPNSESPELDETKDFIEYDNENFSWDEETIIIAHSSACPLILDMLQYFKSPVKQVVLIAGFYEPIDDTGFSERMLPKTEYDWGSIKNSASEFIMINSDDDPWGCTDLLARPVAIKLAAKLVINTNQGHMGSHSYDQPYKEFPLLKRLLAI